MPKGKSDQNTGILEYALRHLEQEREDIQSKIDHIRRQLGGSVSSVATPAAAPAAASPAAAVPGRKKRVLSAAARKRIALAQKKRWAEHRKAKGKAAA
jgi:cell division septum initiation protein DivIVA